MKPKYYDHLGCKLGTSCGGSKNETETGSSIEDKVKPSAPPAAVTGKSIKVDRRRLVATTTTPTKTASSDSSTDSSSTTSKSSTGTAATEGSSDSKEVFSDASAAGSTKDSNKNLHHLDEEFQVLAFGFDKWKVSELLALFVLVA